jgi:CBS domain containing-hemolysin-like protein
MAINYKAIPSSTLDVGVPFKRPSHNLPESVSLNSSALDVMTDLSLVSAMTISPCAYLQEANERMIATSVRLLFVVNQFTHVIGIVTSKDLTGEKIVKHLQASGGKREDIIVRDLMTPQHKIEVIDFDMVAKAKVGDLVETLKRMGRQHALVVESSAETDKQIIRGVLSATQVGKQLGIDIDTADVAGSFAELAAR